MRILLLTALCAGALCAGGCRTAPIHDVPRAAYTIPATVTTEQLAEAIWAAARREGWRTRDVSPGRTLVEKVVRRHRALTEITYDSTGFGLRLLEAENLLHDGSKVHATYNLWATALEKSIQSEIRFRFR
jgi:hypothetical protein